MPRTVVTAAAVDVCIRLLTADAPKPGSVSPMLRSSDQTADCRLQPAACRLSHGRVFYPLVYLSRLRLLGVAVSAV